ncbi:MAG: hypothetical protein AB7T59_16355 [Hyphomonadaceae bacterium]
MTRIALIIAVSSLVLVFSAPVAGGQNPGICPGLSGQDRTRCLERERDRYAAEARAADEEIRRLDQQIELVCATRDLSQAGGSRVSVPYRTGAAVGDAVLGQQRTCEEARERRREAQRRQREARRRR